MRSLASVLLCMTSQVLPLQLPCLEDSLYVLLLTSIGLWKRRVAPLQITPQLRHEDPFQTRLQLGMVQGFISEKGTGLQFFAKVLDLLRRVVPRRQRGAPPPRPDAAQPAGAPARGRPAVPPAAAGIGLLCSGSPCGE